jgi:hypothetical protein
VNGTLACPNRKWEATIVSVDYSQAILEVFQPANATEPVLMQTYQLW